MESAIINPDGALDDVTDFRTGRNRTGAPLMQGQQVFSYRADAPVVRGQCLTFVAPTATVPLSVTPTTTALAASHPHLWAGVALNSAATGKAVDCCFQGVAVVQFDSSDTPAAGNLLLLPDATTGDFAAAAAAVANDVVVGAVLGAPNADGTVLARVGFVPVVTVIDTNTQ